MFSIKRLLLLTTFALVAITDRSAAQCTTCDGDVNVDFKGAMCIKGSFTVQLSTKTTDSATGTTCGSYTESPPLTEKVKLKPNKAYTMTLTAIPNGSDGGLSSVHLEVTCPTCFKVYIDGVETSTYDGAGPGCGNGQGLTKNFTVIIKRMSSGGTGTGGNGNVAGGSSSGGMSGDFSMGGSPNDSAGEISFSSGTITPDLFTPAVLNYENISPDVDVVRDSGTQVLRQIKAPEVLADIITLTATSYEIRFYPSAQVGTKAAGTYPVSGNPAGGLYAVTGSPSHIWRFSSPTNSATTPVIQVTEIQGTVQTDQIFSFISGTWMSEIAGARAETRTETVLSGGDKQIETTVFHPTSGVPASKVRDVHHAFPWGTEKISSVEDPDGDALTTTWAYYESSSDPDNYARLKWVIQPDGSWQRFDYYGVGSGCNGKICHTYRPWKNLPATPSAATLTNCQLTSYEYASPGYSYFRSEISDTEISVLGVEVADNYIWPYLSYLNSWISPLWDDFDDMEYLPIIVRGQGSYSNEKITATIDTSSDVPDYLRGRMAYIWEPDDRLEIHAYEKGTYNSSTLAFNASSSGDCIREFVAQVTYSSSSGVDGKSLQTVRITGPGGGVLKEETQIKTESGFVPLTTTLYGYDSGGHLNLTTVNGRTTYEASWANGKLASETDEQGTTTTFDVYDAEGRVTQDTRLGIVTTRVYDPVGRLTSTTRTSGGLSLGTSTGYDLSGRMTSETSEDGLTAGTVYTAGGRISTRTNSDTSTEITTRYLDGQTQSITGTGVVARYFDYGTDASGFWTKESLGSDTSPRYSQSWRNEEGEFWLSAVSGPSGPIYTATTFDPYYVGRPIARTVPGEAKILFSYDPDTGTLVRQARDLNANNVIDDDSDSIQETHSSYIQDGGNWFRQIVSSRYETDGNATPHTLTTTREQLTGLGTGIASITQSIDSQGHITTSTTAINRSTRTVITTTDVPDSTLDAVEITIDGKLYSTTTPTVSTPTVYTTYDTLGRSTVVTSPRGVVTSTAYHPTTGQVTTVTHAGKQTTYTYHPAGSPGAGRIATETQPDSKIIRTSYTLRGEVFRVWGGATYPLERIYDTYGQQQLLKTYRAGTGWTGTTWPASPGTADTTEWSYNEATGLIHQKIDAASKATTYTYYAASGKPETRQRARGPITTYTWNSLGLSESVTHSDGTPAATRTYDRAGRPKTLADAAGNHTFTYPDDLTTTETIEDGILKNVTRTRTRDTYQRQSVSAITSGTAIHSNEYHYTVTSRLNDVTTGTESATYGYLANSDAIQSLTYKSGTTTRLATTRSYDTSDRLDGVTNTYGGSQTQTFGVSEFDDMNRRKKITREDGTRWNYGYNDKGEVTSGIREKTASPNTAVPGWNYGYTFDEIGNRHTTTTNSRTSTYTPNNLNQIASRTIPRAFDVIGKANAAFNVYINGNAAPRLDEYFYKEVSTTSNNSIHIPYIVDLTDGSAVTRRYGGKFLPATPETFTYDSDGNMIGDGRFTLTWDAENRLIAMETLATVPLPARRKLSFVYDAMGRRIRKTVWHGTSSGGWQLHHQFDFIHELNGWNILAERSGGSKDSFLRTYTWGTDLSGNLSGAGGVGGLISTTFHTSNTTVANGIDLNGNVTLLVNTATGQADATYDYGPFGEPLRQSGEYATLNPFRFSTKYTDDETGFVDYGRRYYIPSLGRWLSKDPIGERGGVNLYGFLKNSGVQKIDVLGLWGKATGCNQSQLNQLKAAESASRDAFEAWYNFTIAVDDTYLTGTFPELAGDNKSFKMAEKFTAMLAKNNKSLLDAVENKSINVKCECSCKTIDFITRSETYAYTPAKTIHFCPIYFGSGALEQAATFAHEMSHAILNTSDVDQWTDPGPDLLKSLNVAPLYEDEPRYTKYVEKRYKQFISASLGK